MGWGALKLPLCPRAGLMHPPCAGQDEPTSLEVTWPDGRVLVRAVASSETNSVLEIPYPQDAADQLLPTPLEVSTGLGCMAPGQAQGCSWGARGDPSRALEAEESGCSCVHVCLWYLQALLLLGNGCSPF